VKPVIRHICLYNGPIHAQHLVARNLDNVVALLMANIQTLEVGYNYLKGWYNDFWDDLKQLMQLKTICFEVLKDMCLDDCTHFDCSCWNAIDLVKYQFEPRWPFSVVERLVVSESERENRLNSYLWRWLYGTHKLAQYVQA
jgi:hypothetical protein